LLECEVRVDCASRDLLELIRSCLGNAEVPVGDRRIDLDYSLRFAPDGFALARAERSPLPAEDEGRLLFELEQDLTLELQRLRRDLYFLHSAALGTPKGAVLFVGESGAGKSTLTWALLQHDFEFMSDELAPIDAQEMLVLPYPRALCLKEAPPEPYALPPAALRTSRGLHVPTVGRGSPPPRARRLHAIFFLGPRVAARETPMVRPMSAAEAAARLLANALNPLSHAADGLDAALAIASRAACFELRAGDLGPTCALVGASLDGHGVPGVDPSAEAVGE